MPPTDKSTTLPLADLAKLGQLLDEHRPKLLAMLQRRIDRAMIARIDAEDVFQLASTVAQKRWREFQSNSHASPYVWLYGLMREQLFRRWRDETRVKRDVRKEVVIPDRSSQQLIASGTGPKTAAEREELKQRIRQVLELLPDGDYEIVKMRQFDQLSFREAAEILGITENAATVRYVRAIKKLRTIWEALFSEEESQP